MNEGKLGAEEMAQGIKHSPCKHENPSLDPRNSHKCQTGVAVTCNPSIGGAETEDSLGQAD